MKILTGLALICVLSLLLFVMWIAEVFHKADGGRSWLEAMNDI